MRTIPLHFNTNLIVRELKRRKISVTRIPQTTLLEARYKGHVELIDDTDLSVMPAPLRYILDDKWKTKMLLRKMKLRVAPGMIFGPADIDTAISYAKRHGFPLVLKPRSSTHGYLVRMNIDSQKEFEMLFEKLCRETHCTQDILVEKQIAGNEFRLTVTKNGFNAAVFRPFPSVMGDGVHTIKQLITRINETRENKRTSCLCRIWIDHEMERYLSKKGLHLVSIPRAGDRIYVRSNSNVSTGGGCIDVTDQVHKTFWNLAKKILEGIPGLPYVGIDILTKDISKPGPYTICELNPAPGISLHTHPELGVSRDLPRALVDLIFPETASRLH